MYCYTARGTESVEVREGILYCFTASSQNWVSGGQRGVLFHSSWNGVSGGQRGYTVSQLSELGQWRPDSTLFHGG